MEMVKICPTCAAENNPSEMMCCRCFGDICGIAPSGPATSVIPAGQQRRSEEPCLFLITADKEKIAVSNGDIVGRSALGKTLLAPLGKVSRQHARFHFADGIWLIQDLGSANGTYIDGIKVPAGQMVPLAAGQKVRLSSTFEAMVSTE